MRITLVIGGEPVRLLLIIRFLVPGNTLQWHLFGRREGEAQEVAQEKRAGLTRELEERKQPILKMQWSPRQSSRGDACANGYGSGDVPTKKCEESTDTHEKR